MYKIALILFISLYSTNSNSEIIDSPQFLQQQECGVDYVQNIQEGLLLHYSLDNNGVDASINGNDGNLVETQGTEDRFGNTLNALLFDINAGVDIPYSPILQPQFPLSISVWVKFDSNEPYESAVFATNFVEGDYKGISMSRYSSTGQLSFWYGGGLGFCGPGNRRGVITVNPAPTGKWIHIVAQILNKNSFNIYVDGCLQNLIPNGSGPFEIAYDSNGGRLGQVDTNTDIDPPITSLKGSLDEFYFWDRVIKEEEVLYLYDKYLVPEILAEDVYELIVGNSIDIEIESSFEDILWSTGEEGNSISISDPGMYSVEGYYNCILVCHEFIVESEIAFDQTCDGAFEGDLNQNLLLHYNLDNNGVDDSGNGFDGTMIDVSSAEDRFGDTGTAVDFNTGSKVVLPESSLLQPNYPFAVSFWSLVKDINVHNVFFASDYVENDLSGAWVFQVPDGRLSIGIGNGKGYCGPTNRRSKVSVDKVKLNEWNHIFVNFTGPDDIHLFVNGCEVELVDSGTGSWDISYSDNPGVIGEFDTGTSPSEGLYNLNGSLDDFYYWDRTITEEEVLYLYDKFQVPELDVDEIFILSDSGATSISLDYEFDDVLWSNGTIGNEVFINTPGNYRVEGYYNCILVCDSFRVISDCIDLDFEWEIEVGDNVCYGESSGSILMKNQGYSELISIDGSDYSDIHNYNSLKAGKYSVSILIGDNCLYDTIVNITENDVFIVSLPKDTTVTLGCSLEIEPDQTGFSNYFWQPGLYLDCNDCETVISTPNDNILYVLRVENEYGCYSYDSIYIYVDIERNVYIPNVFNPTLNDKFYLSSNKSLSSYDLEVYDRWGELIYNGKTLPPSNPSIGWDGTYKGQMLSPGVFTIIINAHYVDNKTHIFASDLTLFR